MTPRLSLLFPYDKDKQIFYFSLLCIYTICSKSVLSSQHRCTASGGGGPAHARVPIHAHP